MIPKAVYDIILDLMPMICLAVVVVITLRLVYLLSNHLKVDLYKEITILIFGIYVLLLFELVTSTDFESYSNNFIPFKEILRYQRSSRLFYRNVIGNIILFVPYGYFTSGFCKVKKLYLNILVCLITSSTIEIIQASIGRSFDIDDIILNVGGGFIGYVIYKMESIIFRKVSNEIKSRILLNLISILLIGVLLLIILNIYGVII